MLDQFFTNPELADRMVQWAIAGIEPPWCEPLHILEPSAGDGAIVRAVRNTGIDCELYAVEIDSKQAKKLRQLEGVNVHRANFMRWKHPCRFHLAITNPPYRGGQAEAHCLRALEMCERVVILCLASFCFSAGRSELLWKRTRIRRRVILSKRPLFYGPDCKGDSAKYDYQILDLERHDREPGQVDLVAEEIW